MSTSWGVCVCVCVRVCVHVCAQLQEFRLCQTVPLIFLGQQSWCWKPDPALSAFFTAVPGKQSPHRNGPSSLLPARADLSVGGHTHPDSLTVQAQVHTQVHTQAHTGHTQAHTQSAQVDIPERISSEALDVLFRCSNRNKHLTHSQDYNSSPAPLLVPLYDLGQVPSPA